MAITHSLHRGAQTQPDKPALVFGDRVTRYGALAEQVARCAAAFQSFQSGGTVGILSLNSDRAIVAFYGASWAGMVPNYLNVRWSQHELSASIEDFLPGILLVDEHFADMGQRLKECCPSIQTLVFLGDADSAPEGVAALPDLLEQAQPIADQAAGDSELAFLNYTGGTTGKGKGVMVSHGAHAVTINACIAEGAFVTGPAFMVVPLFHISGIGVVSANLTLCNTLFILPAFDPERLMQLVADERIEHGFLVPTMIQVLLHHPRFDDYRLDSLRFLGYGASPIDEALMMETKARLPGIGLAQLYGQTEGVPVSVLKDVDHTERGLELGRTRSAGMACNGVDIEIRDGEGQVLPHSEIGEICIRGRHLMMGYLNDPEQTAQALRDGWLVTGDAGYLSEAGYLFIVDRIKDMIVSGGENVYSVEVESAINHHPAVEECAVVGLADADWGERVHAELVLKAAEQLDLEALKAHCRDYLAGYKLPKSMSIVEALPLTAVGKIDKVAIRTRNTAES